MTALISNNTQVRIAGTELNLESEPLETIDNIIYRMKNKEKSIWKKDKNFIVNGTDEGDNFKIDWANGYIEFDEARYRDELTVSGEYITTTSIGRVLSYSLDREREFTEYHFVGAIDKTDIPLGTKATGTIEALEIKDPYFIDAFLNADKLLLEFVFNDIVKSIWVYIDTHSINHTGGELVLNNISFVSTTE